jgi:hypothetical protein
LNRIVNSLLDGECSDTLHLDLELLFLFMHVPRPTPTRFSLPAMQFDFIPILYELPISSNP